MGDKQQYLDEKAQAILDKHGIPHIAAVLVRDNGSTVVHTAKGVRDSTGSTSASSNAVTKSDFFNVGSIAKPVTGFLLACLIKQGVLTWETTIADVFTEFKSKAFRDRCGMNTTFLGTKVYELMAHTSGINGRYYHRLDDNTAWNGDMDPFRFPFDQGIQHAQTSRDKEWQNLQSVMYQRYLYTVLCLKKEKYQFGSSRNLRYENTASSGYGSTATVCAAMVERRTGKAFETVMTELLASPLQMEMIYGKLPRGMQFHAWDGAQSAFVPQPAYNNDFAPFISKFVVGGMHFTVNGMAQYIKYNLRAINNAAVFDIDEYHAPVTDAVKGGLYRNGRRLNHNGASNVSLADMEVAPHDGYGYAVMQNCNGGTSAAAAAEMFGELKTMHANWSSI